MANKWVRLEKKENGFKQVVEIFNFNPFEFIPNKNFLENCVECFENTEIFMWYVDGVFIENEAVPIVQIYDNTIDGLTIDQLIDVLKWQGAI